MAIPDNTSEVFAEMVSFYQRRDGTLLVHWMRKSNMLYEYFLGTVQSKSLGMGPRPQAIGHRTWNQN